MGSFYEMRFADEPPFAVAGVHPSPWNDILSIPVSSLYLHPGHIHLAGKLGALEVHLKSAIVIDASEPI
jgi:hypothetical protein